MTEPSMLSTPPRLITTPAGREALSIAANVELPDDPRFQVSLGDGLSWTPTEVATVEQFHRDGDRIIRTVARRDGRSIRSSIVDLSGSLEIDLASAFDLSWLKSRRLPRIHTRNGSFRVADLFSGCGGMTLGVIEAGRALGMRALPILAIDSDPASLHVYARNFADARAIGDPIETWIDGQLGDGITAQERILRQIIEPIDLIVAGPPCQGNSNLNNHTRYADPKNALYLKVVRFAEVMQPDHIIIENVPGVLRDEERVLQTAYTHLRRLGYGVAVVKFYSERFGVAQTRHRVFVLASRTTPVAHLQDRDVLEARYGVSAPRSFSWACGDLLDVEHATVLDNPACPEPRTRQRIDHLFDHDLYELPDHQRPDCHKDGHHRYQSVYGRMYWDEPAPTITTGFTTMGQGRFVHPKCRRTITPHEAARLQFFPDGFDLCTDLNREAHKRMIGNAVPPKLTYIAALELLR